MPPRSSSSLTSSTSETTKRRVSKHRDLWIQYFSDALIAILGADNDDMADTEISESEAATITQSARNIADAALNQTEERFKGL